MPDLGRNGLQPSRLGLGGNVFGWTADRDASFAVLDAYTSAGGNFIDTADVYSVWVEGNSGGDSETIIGDWHTARGNRADVIIATKVGQLGGREGLAADNVRRAADDSLRRLRTDYIDIFYAHIDDQTVPLEESLGALSGLVDAGKVRHIAGSNISADRLAEALDVSDREGLHRYVAVQNEYNLMNRDFEGDLLAVCERRDVALVPYFGLAGGFLTGKYRPGTTADGPRAGAAQEHLADERAGDVLDTLDAISAGRGVSVAAVALAWLAAKPAVVAPLASARTPEQLDDLLQMTSLTLTADEMSALDRASA
jgi:aryl-alcohol dehydrogenase-like predicted oxidoreductase